MREPCRPELDANKLGIARVRKYAEANAPIEHTTAQFSSTTDFGCEEYAL